MTINVGFCIICLLLICFVTTVVNLFCIRDCRWVWSEAGQQMELEAALGIGGFGYPVCINSLQPSRFIVLLVLTVKLLGSARVWLLGSTVHNFSTKSYFNEKIFFSYFCWLCIVMQVLIFITELKVNISVSCTSPVSKECIWFTI